MKTILLLLSGYHKCTRDESVLLSALIYRVKFGDSKQEMQSLSQMLSQLVPTDLIKTMSAQDWKREIIRTHNQGRNEIHFEHAE